MQTEHRFYLIVIFVEQSSFDRNRVCSLYINDFVIVQRPKMRLTEFHKKNMYQFESRLNTDIVHFNYFFIKHHKS